MWTKGLPLLSSPPFSFLASFDYSFAPRRASRIPFPLPLFFFLLDGVRRAAKNSLVAATSEGCIDSFRRPASSSPPLPQYFHLLLLLLAPPSTNCFFSINFVSWDAYRLHEQLPRRLPPAISLSFSRPLRRLLIARPIVLGSCFFPKTVLYLRETRSLLVTLRSSTCQFLRFWILIASFRGRGIGRGLLSLL